MRHISPKCMEALSKAPKRTILQLTSICSMEQASLDRCARHMFLHCTLPSISIKPRDIADVNVCHCQCVLTMQKRMTMNIDRGMIANGYVPRSTRTHPTLRNSEQGQLLRSSLTTTTSAMTVTYHGDRQRAWKEPGKSCLVLVVLSVMISMTSLRRKSNTPLHSALRAIAIATISPATFVHIRREGFEFGTSLCSLLFSFLMVSLLLVSVGNS